MENQKPLPFPYEFKEIEPEQQEQLQNMFDAVVLKCYRVEPKGYFVYEPYLRDAANIYNMPLRSTDIFVGSYQRSGTTWAQELVWLLANDLDYERAAAIPLFQRYPFLDLFMLFDEHRIEEQVKCIKARNPSAKEEPIVELCKIVCQPASGMLATMPSPRFIKTHIPLSLMNPKLLDTSKMVYVARDPRDVAVSCYHHAKLFHIIAFTGNFKEFWHLFHQDMYMLLPIFEHIKEAWDKRNHPNMLFLFYEELRKDLPAAIRQVADFLGKELNQEQLDQLCDHLSIENFRKNPSINFEDMKERGFLAKEGSFIRKGKAGGWRDYFDEEMTAQAQQWIDNNLRDTDL